MICLVPRVFALLSIGLAVWGSPAAPLPHPQMHTHTLGSTNHSSIANSTSHHHHPSNHSSHHSTRPTSRQTDGDADTYGAAITPSLADNNHTTKAIVGAEHERRQADNQSPGTDTASDLHPSAGVHDQDHKHIGAETNDPGSGQPSVEPSFGLHSVADKHIDQSNLLSGREESGPPSVATGVYVDGQKEKEMQLHARDWSGSNGREGPGPAKMAADGGIA